MRAGKEIPGKNWAKLKAALGHFAIFPFFLPLSLSLFSLEMLKGETKEAFLSLFNSLLGRKRKKEWIEASGNGGGRKEKTRFEPLANGAYWLLQS